MGQAIVEKTHHRDHWFPGPLHCPICSLSLLFSPTKFSANKIFLTSAVKKKEKTHHLKH
jgi:hypothetical protein